MAHSQELPGASSYAGKTSLQVLCHPGFGTQWLNLPTLPHNMNFGNDRLCCEKGSIYNMDTNMSSNMTFHIHIVCVDRPTEIEAHDGNNIYDL